MWLNWEKNLQCIAAAQMQNRAVFVSEPRGYTTSGGVSDQPKEGTEIRTELRQLKWQKDQVYISIALFCTGTVTSLAITSVSPLCHTSTKQDLWGQWVSLPALKCGATVCLDNLAGTHQPYLPHQAREQAWGRDSGWAIHPLWLFSAAEVTIKWLPEPSINQKSINQSNHNPRI